MLATTFLSSYHGGMILHINEALAVRNLNKRQKEPFLKAQCARFSSN